MTACKTLDAIAWFAYCYAVAATIIGIVEGLSWRKEKRTLRHEIGHIQGHFDDMRDQRDRAETALAVCSEARDNARRGVAERDKLLATIHRNTLPIVNAHLPHVDEGPSLVPEARKPPAIYSNEWYAELERAAAKAVKGRPYEY